MKKFLITVFSLAILAVSVCTNTYAADGPNLKTKAILVDYDTNDIVRPSTKRIAVLFILTNNTSVPLTLRNFKLYDRFQLIQLNSLFKDVTDKITWSSNPTNTNLDNPFLIKLPSIDVKMQPQQSVSFVASIINVTKGLNSKTKTNAVALSQGMYFVDYAFNFLAADGTTAGINAPEDSIIRIADTVEIK